ncbi:hypothetical protein HWV62_30727 [Athelia sp. TMB]|nr:hypothetical protein HWV62_30727 [Athelia sp. TMB]
MDRAPPEVWLRISSYACTDAGITGRSLSLVSKFIRAASARVKLQSIAAHGPQQIYALDDLLRRTPPHLRLVKYLYISLAPPSSFPHGLGESGRPSLPVGESRQVNKTRAMRLAQVAEKKQLVAACCRILQMVSESIEILYLDGRGSLNFGDSAPIVFPRLEELVSNDLPISNDRDAMPTLALFPRLHHWHLMTYPRRSKPDVFTAISTLAPIITHLRFSDLQQEAYFPSYLKVALDITNSQQSPSVVPMVGFHHLVSHIGRLPSSIESVYVKPAAPPAPGGMCGTPHTSYAHLIVGLEVLRKLDSRIVPLPSYNNHLEPRCALSEWEGRINGGDGCWSLPERIEN